MTNKDNPIAMIFSITAQDSNNDGHIARLYVTGIKNDSPCFCGIAKTDGEARIIAENQEACIEMLPKKQLPKN